MPPLTALETPFTDQASSERGIRVMRPRRAAPEQLARPTRAEVDLGALRHNLQAVRRAAGTSRLWAVLKADAYGHGAPAVARTLERAGLEGIAVALVEEALELREAGLTAPILVMGGYFGDAEAELLARNLTPVVYHAGHVERLARAQRLTGLQGPIAVHLKIDTGMSRLGVRADELPALLEELRAYPQLRIEGVMTHLSCADLPSDDATESVREQLRIFDGCLPVLRRFGHAPKHVHAENSAAILRRTHFGVRGYESVRPGIALFGLAPVPTSEPATIELRPTLRLRTEIVCLRRAPAGTPVGYGNTFRTQRDSLLATVPMGYGDGLPRSLGNRGSMLVRGVPAPIVGAVSMDLATLDVTAVPGVELHDEVVVLGSQRGVLGSASIGLDTFAEQAGLIPWDVMTSVSRRVPRFYRDA